MSYRLEGNGLNLDLTNIVNYYLDIRQQQVDSFVPVQKIIGRDKVYADKQVRTNNSIIITMSGYINSSSIGSTEIAYYNLLKILNSKPLPLKLYNGIDSTSDYYIEVYKKSFREDRIPSGGKTIGIEIIFEAINSVWEKVYESQSVTQIQAQTNPIMRNLPFTENVRTPPTFLIEPVNTIKDPTITSYEFNALLNSDFSDDLDNWTVSTTEISLMEAWTGDRSVLVTAGGYLEQDKVPLEIGNTILISCMAKRITGVAATITAAVSFYQDNDTLISTDTDNTSLSSDGWTNFLNIFTVPALTAYGKARITVTVGNAYIDAVAIPPFVIAAPIAHRVNPNRQFAITGDTTFTSAEKLLVDMETYEVKKFTGGSWVDILHLCNGVFFECLTPKSFIVFNDENNVAFDVTVRHRPKTYEV